MDDIDIVKRKAGANDEVNCLELLIRRAACERNIVLEKAYVFEPLWAGSSHAGKGRGLSFFVDLC